MLMYISPGSALAGRAADAGPMQLLTDGPMAGWYFERITSSPAHPAHVEQPKHELQLAC
jgi:hypothetical protein